MDPTALVHTPTRLILKLGDDLRQDMITLRMFSLFEKVGGVYLVCVHVGVCVYLVCVHVGVCIFGVCVYLVCVCIWCVYM